MGHMLQPGLTPATHMVFISELTHKEELLTGLPGFSRTVFFKVLKHRDRFGRVGQLPVYMLLICLCTIYVYRIIVWA